MKTYLKNIFYTAQSLLIGLKITMLHFVQARHSRKPVGVADSTYFDQKEGIVTLQYPDEKLPVPDNGRYKLHNEIDDCIVCDKCAKICPVNCIDIEPIRAVEEFGKTSDGTPKRLYAAKFDIDMSKCCFCGLCTVVCPTECLTMTKEYDFSVFDVKEHNFEFGDMSPEMIGEKQAEFDVFAVAKQKDKDEKAALKAKEKANGDQPKPKTGGFKPRVKPLAKANDAGEKAEGADQSKATPSTAKPMFRPKVKTRVDESENVETTVSDTEKAKSKPVFRPKMKPKVKPIVADGEVENASNPKPAKPIFRPKIKKIESNSEQENTENQEGSVEKPKPSKPVFRPKIKPKKVEDESSETKEEPNEEKPKPARPVFRPKVKGAGKVKPVIKPVMKKKPNDDSDEPKETS